jgi:hypothetical protein
MKNPQPQPPEAKPKEQLEPIEDDWFSKIDKGSATEAEIDKFLLQLEQEKNDTWFAELIER